MDVGLCAEKCADVLQEKQNSDGGWGYHEETPSRVEPTCWAVSALTAAGECGKRSGAITNARHYLLANQKKEGFWTASPEMKTGNWVTSLVCAVLSQQAGTESPTLAAMEWLCGDYPLDSSPLLRFLRSFSKAKNISQHENTYRGWGWTPRTSSWVEPTAFALLAMQEFDQKRLPSVAARRQKSAVGLLYDRRCPDGGWNCGNPRVYGVAGEALVLPTAWALISLRNLPKHESKSLSLAWLEKQMPKIQSPGSLAVAGMCLETYGKESTQLKSRLHDYDVETLLEDGIHVLAWVCLAMSPGRRWPARIEGRHEPS